MSFEDYYICIYYKISIYKKNIGFLFLYKKKKKNYLSRYSKLYFIEECISYYFIELHVIFVFYAVIDMIY